MKKFILFVFVFTYALSAQEFFVESVKGKAFVQKGISEKWMEIKTGDELSGSDVIMTEENSSVRLAKGEESFVLDSYAAVNINYLKKMTINELLLALAMEEIKNLPADENTSSNTAVYGKEESERPDYGNEFFEEVGRKKINGAKQLAANGYEETAILAAKETFRKYPHTRKILEDRIFLVDLLFGKQLYDECLTELEKMSNLFTGKEEKAIIDERMNKIKTKLTK